MSLRLLCVVAHPDDESSAFGGALLLAQSSGVEVSVLCLTSGQAASNRGLAQSAEELGRLRRAEFAAACAVLQVSRCEVLDYPDGALREENFAQLTGSIVRYIRLWKPQVVLTFGSEGSINLHRDHQMAGLAATAAFQWAGRPQYYAEQLTEGLEPYSPQKLYYSAPSFTHPKTAEDQQTVAPTPYSLTLELNEDLRARKVAAFMEHVTQAPLADRLRRELELHGQFEHYLLVASRAVRALDIQEDSSLFDGIRDDS